jgi:hypothetical protein
MSQNGEALTAAKLRATHARLRIDRLRVALRASNIDEDRVVRELAEWLELFRDVRDGAFRVLVLEVLRDIRDERVDELLWEASQDRSDGVRLESLRLLCQRFPEELPRLAEAHADDENLEVRVLLAVRMHDRDAGTAEAMLLRILLSEAGEPKERQALERVLGFFAEDVHATHLLPQLEEIRAEFDDPEDFFGWAFQILQDQRQRNEEA